MSNNKPKHASVTFDGFGGIDLTAEHTGTATATDIVNFRIREDGSLEKRCGYRLLADLGGTIRAFCSDLTDGVYRSYLLVDDTVYSMDLTTGERQALATVGTDTGPACFCFFRGSLYLLDGHGFYELREDALIPTVGYVPLVAKDWPCSVPGEPHEPRNLLNRHARLTYLLPDPPSYFLCTGEEVESVESVTVNGVRIGTDRYEIDNNFKTINVTGLEAGDRVTICLTYANGEDALLAKLCASTDSLAFGGAGDNRLLFWGGGDAGDMFCSAHVPSDSLKESLAGYPESGPVYLPVGHEFRVGEGRYPIRGALRSYDRVLIFSEGETWLTASEASGEFEFPAVNVNSNIGCTPRGGVALAGNLPVTVGRSALYRWSYNGDAANRCDANSLSRPIEPMLEKSDCTEGGLYYDRFENELWWYNRQTGSVKIYSFARKAWVRFTGIYADRFFEGDGTVGFIRGGRVYLFDKSLTHDPTEDGVTGEIVGEYRSGVTDFGTEARKNLCSLVFRGDTDGGTVTVTVSPDEGRETVCVIADGKHTHSILRKRVSSGRFRSASLGLRAPGAARQVIHGLTVTTR